MKRSIIQTTTVLLTFLLMSVPPVSAHEGSEHHHPTQAPETFLILNKQGAANRVKITEKDGWRLIDANNIPDHPTGNGARGPNPHTIGEKDNHYRVTLDPQFAAQPTKSFPNAFGVALNGVFFEPSTAEFWRGDRNWNEEAIDGNGRRLLGLDENFGHVQPDGSYHYHGTPIGLVKNLAAKNNKQVMLLGYAADGFPIYGQYGYSDPKDAGSQVKKLTSSYQLKGGRRPQGGPSGNHDGTYGADYEFVKDKGDLDEFNGRFAVTPEYPKGIYHYVVTDSYPFISRSWRGTPDPSFFKRRGPGGPGGPGGGGRPPAEGGRPPAQGGRPPFPPPPR